MNHSFMRRTAAVAIALVVPALAASAASKSKAVKGHFSQAKAEANAVRAVGGGKATSIKQEFEDGRWQYAVVVKKGQQLYEVEVSDKDGKVYDQEKTSAAEERSEAAADAKAAKKK